MRTDFQLWLASHPQCILALYRQNEVRYVPVWYIKPVFCFQNGESIVPLNVLRKFVHVARETLAFTASFQPHAQ